jgi:hypothetical protein
MASKVEIIILGRNEAAAAFKGAKQQVQDFGKEVDGAAKKSQDATPKVDGFGKKTEETGKKTEEATPKVKGLGDKLDEIGGKLQKTGALMTAGITAPLIGLGLAATDAASDMAESQSKVNVVFGESVGIITEFADTAAEKLGMSSQAATESAGTFGNLFTSMGIGQEKAAGMSTEVLQLAADLGSFNNIDPTEMLEKLRSGLVGETEPLRSVGINLNADAIEAKALAMGLGQTTTAAKDNSAAVAALAKAQSNLSTEQAKLTALTQGHSKTSEEAVAAMRKVRGAELDVSTARDRLADATKKYGKSSLEAKQAAQTLAEKQATLTTTQRDYNTVVNGVSTSSKEYQTQLGKVSAAQSAVEAATTKANTAVGKSTTELSAADKAQAAWALILEQSKNAQGDFARTADGLANSQRTAKAEMANLSAELGTMLVPIMKQVVGTVRDLIAQFQGLSPETQQFILIGAGILAAIGPVVGVIGTLLTVVGALVPVFGAVAAVITGTVLPALGALVLAVGWPLLIIAAVVAAVVGLYLAYQSNFLGIRDIVDSVVGSIVGFFNNTLLPALQSVANFVSGIVQSIIGFFQNLYNTLVGHSIIPDLVNGILGAFRTLSSSIGGALSGFVSGVKGAVNSVIGFINNLIGAWNGLSFRIPGFNVTLPHVDLPPPIGRIGGGNLGWPGVSVQTPNLPKIPTLDTGGIISEPTLALLAANRRPEAVVPLDKLGQMGAGKTVEYHLHLHGTQTSSVRAEFETMQLLWSRS